MVPCASAQGFYKVGLCGSTSLLPLLARWGAGCAGRD